MRVLVIFMKEHFGRLVAKLEIFFGNWHKTIEEARLMDSKRKEFGQKCKKVSEALKELRTLVEGEKSLHDIAMHDVHLSGILHLEIEDKGLPDKGIPRIR
jgi:hypothetical protein